eukprot:TRINITY_DN36278_c0_g1_i1.p1 TRINITY_DN36278_c0_g1~~TRINITY_DN36278_c0_g1_i1.p1  ORF type:complete len:603 (+),score=152.06 TRINITY_DN36278_c0_g1_i1:123-1811(+)
MIAAGCVLCCWLWLLKSTLQHPPQTPRPTPRPTAHPPTPTPPTPLPEAAPDTPAPRADVDVGDSARPELPPLPYEYVVHRRLPAADALAAGQERQRRKVAGSCADVSTPPLPVPPHAALRPVPAAAVSVQSLETEFRFKLGGDGPVADSQRERLPDGKAWWVPGDGNIPCTAEAQHALWAHQHPSDCASAKFLVSRLKEGAHGLGSALSLVVHDLLSAVLLRRVLIIEPGRWYFAPSACSGKYQGWECYFASPSHCALPSGVSVHTLHNGRDAKSAKHKAVKKKSFDVPGAGRNDLPQLLQLLGGNAQCEQQVKEWVADPSNAYLMGTFARGADPMLIWAMSQALRYLVRGPQPWFAAAISANLAVAGYPQKWESAGAVVFEQLRGEEAKFREYYNAFGCHDVDLAAYVNLSATAIRQSGGGVVYISGNTPQKRYQELKDRHEQRGESVWSTWQHPAAVASRETARWGADSLLVSWVDFWAGVASTGWVCIVQSNWCRMINFLRLTAGRAACPFYDLGMRMLALPDERRRYCIARSEWPKKPFSTVLRKNEAVLKQVLKPTG